MVTHPEELGCVLSCLVCFILRDERHPAQNEKRILNYYVWYDENAQKTSNEKIREAMDAYTTRFAMVPDLVLVHLEDKAELAGVVIRGERSIQRNNFWLGMQAHEQREESNA